MPWANWLELDIESGLRTAASSEKWWNLSVLERRTTIRRFGRRWLEEWSRLDAEFCFHSKDVLCPFFLQYQFGVAAAVDLSTHRQWQKKRTQFQSACRAMSFGFLFRIFMNLVCDIFLMRFRLRGQRLSDKLRNQWFDDGCGKTVRNERECELPAGRIFGASNDWTHGPADFVSSATILAM